MEFKWFSIMVIGCALALALGIAATQYASAPIGAACAAAGSEWRNGNCIPKEVK